MLSTARRPRVRRLLSLLGTLLLVGGLLPVAAAAPVLAISPNVVISEIYGGGGNTGAPYDHDYIELYNRGTSPVALGGNSVQYTGATSTTNFGSSANLRTELPAFTLNPGQHFLIQEVSESSTGEPLPTPDWVDPTAIPMALGAGKVVYVTGTAPLGCNGSTTPCNADQLARIVDLVGYGTSATFFEGAGPTANTSNTTAAIRGAGGATDTDNNNTDFRVAAPDPDNSVELPPSVSAISPADGATNVGTSADVTITFSEPVNVTNPWFTITCGTSGGHTALVTGGPTTFTLNPDADFANSETCTVTVDDQAVSDQDSDDPPDTMAADFIASFETASTAAPPDINISEVYGGGGNSGAILRNDFIELYNTTTSAVPLAGWSVQYASATGATWAVTNLTGTIPAGGHYLIQEASGGLIGAPLPAADASGTIDINATAGKVALVSTTTALAGACPSGPPIVDFVGYGAPASCFEGVAPAPSPSNTLSIQRAGDGATDTESNANDFRVGTPTPTPSSEQPPTVASTDPTDGATGVSRAANIAITFSEPVNVTGSWFTIICGISGIHTAAATGGPTAFDLNPDTDFVANENCTVTVVAANVADQDAIDPPDTMLADFSATFTTAAPPTVDDAPAVSSTTPANGATGVATNANVSITFSEPVNVTGSWFAISCASSGLHAAAATGGPTTFSLDPGVNFSFGELCTTTVTAAQVTDQDADDPPDQMAADYVFSFTVADLAVLTLPYAQAWTNTAAITVNDDWSGVPGVAGFLGQDITTAPAVDPQTLLTTSTLAGDVDVIANQTDPNTLASGGVAEFHITDPVVALQGSGTADAPYVLFNFATSGLSDIRVAYNLRDIDGSVDNTVQPVALQYRVGSTGNFTNIPAGFVADATTGPSLATQVTAVSAILPAAANNQAVVQVRVMTTNAVGSDEWVGIDDISIATLTGDLAPMVMSTNPANGQSNVALDASPTVTFSEPVTATTASFELTCATSGGHTTVVADGPTTYTINPDLNFTTDELCTLTVIAANVTDVDANDPPDNMTANAVVSFRTVGPSVHIREVQGATHVSPFNGRSVVVTGVVTAKRANGFYMQDPSPDSDDATSEAILVFTQSAPTVNVGDDVSVAGLVTEFRPGGAAVNLSTTEITAPAISVTSTGNPLPPTIILGTGGGIPPNTVIEDDATGDVETSGVFDPAADGIDFYESLEAMRVQVNNPVAVGPRTSFGEIVVLADDGANASVRTARDGIVIRANDFNPERIQLDDAVLASSTPNANVGDHFTTAAVGVLDYDFGNFKIELTAALTVVPGGLSRESTDPAGPSELSVATFNVENLDANEPQSKFDALAAMIVGNLASPDVIALEEIQDNNGARNDAITDANLTLDRLTAAIAAAGGPTYDWRQINPVDDQDGGEPGGNIRVGFMFRTDRGLAFVDRPGGDSTTATTIVSGSDGPQLSFSPGRVEPANAAWSASRKPLAGEFTYAGRTLFLIANHFNSKGGDQPLFGHFQPPVRSSEVQRHQQAQLVNTFVDSILTVDPNANVIVLGDINDFEFSTTMDILEGGVLTDLMETLSQDERYSYVFEGNSQVLDHIIVSENLLENVPLEFDPVHANAEFWDQISDHDPSVARFLVATPGTVVVNKTGQGGTALAGAGFTLYVDAAPTGGSRGAEDTTAAGTCTTNSAGTCSITSVALGTYWLVETTTPNGYATVAPTAVTVGAGPAPGVGDTDTINLANQPVPGTVVINKTGHDGAALAGAGFTLYVDAAPLGGSRGAEDMTAAGGCSTTSSGTCSITGVALGRYWLVETTTPPGYTTVSPTAVTVDLGPSANVGDTDTVNVTNQATPGTVVVNKTGQGGTALAGAGFTLYVDAAPTGGSRGAEDTTAAGTCTTNSAGTCSITSVALGTYWLVETTTPNGYATVAPTAVTVGAGPAPGVGDTDTINLANQPVPGTVVINKTGQGRAKTVGIVFTLYVDVAPVGGSRGREDSAIAGSCVTAPVDDDLVEDHDGPATCSIINVPLGRYWLVETVPKGNAPVAPIAVTVNLGRAPNVGDTDTFAVMNKPKGSPKQP